MSNAVQNVTAVKFSQRVKTNTDVPLEMFAFAAFGLLHKHTRWPNSSLSTNKTRQEFDRPSFGLPFLAETKKTENVEPLKDFSLPGNFFKFSIGSFEYKLPVNISSFLT